MLEVLQNILNTKKWHSCLSLWHDQYQYYLLSSFSRGTVIGSFVLNSFSFFFLFCSKCVLHACHAMWHVWSWPFQGALPRRFLRHMGLVLRLAEWTTERLVDLYEPLGCLAFQQESYFLACWWNSCRLTLSFWFSFFRLSFSDLSSQFTWQDTMGRQVSASAAHLAAAHSLGATLTPSCIMATVEIFQFVTQNFKQSWKFPNYVWSLRDVGKVIQGITLALDNPSFATVDLYKLWAHEILCVFENKLQINIHKQLFQVQIVDVDMNSHLTWIQNIAHISSPFKSDAQRLLRVQATLRDTLEEYFGAKWKAETSLCASADNFPIPEKLSKRFFFSTVKNKSSPKRTWVEWAARAAKALFGAIEHDVWDMLFEWCSLNVSICWKRSGVQMYLGVLGHMWRKLRQILWPEALWRGCQVAWPSLMRRPMKKLFCQAFKLAWQKSGVTIFVIEGQEGNGRNGRT